jgi:hypothetical protein
MNQSALNSMMIATCFVAVTACSGATTSDPTPTSTTGALAAGTSGAGGKPTDPGTGANGAPGCSAPPPAPPPDACTTIDAGFACGDPDAKNLIEKLCAAQGATSGGFSWDGKQCSATCCAIAPPAPPQSCTWTTIGDGSACVSYVDIKTQAVAICDAQKSEPHTVATADDCAGGATITKLECCVSAAPNEPSPAPPPPTK